MFGFGMDNYQRKRKKLNSKPKGKIAKIGKNIFMSVGNDYKDAFSFGGVAEPRIKRRKTALERKRKRQGKKFDMFY